MQLSDFIESITRANSCLAEREQEYLLDMLDREEELYRLRRSTREEQVFWNQFWHKWDFPKLRDARQQAIRDMVADGFCLPVKENPWLYRNFEKAISADAWAFLQRILFSLSNSFPELSCDTFYNLQRFVQQQYADTDLLDAMLRRIHEKPAVEQEQPGKKEIEETDNSATPKNQSAIHPKEDVEPPKIETKWERRARLKKTMEEKRLKKAQSKARREAQKEARRKAEIEAQIEARRKAEIEAQIEARRKAEIEAQIEAHRKAEIEAQIEAHRKAEIEAQIEARRKAEIEAQIEARRKAEIKAQIEARRKAEIEAQKEARRKAEIEAQKEARKKAGIEAQKEARRKAEIEAQKEAHRKVQKEAGIIKARIEALIAKIKARRKA